ncbi:hypothetical protein [Bifidobacterium callitrichidarum]|uniref:hypothetical protein n=1 Tax=Bifidobacterium callitrichidarum TaxID=2052941 RepID=UPI0011B2881E|nr:hypothetical protein [Bifidobacterium callitrichidarum]
MAFNLLHGRLPLAIFGKWWRFTLQRLEQDRLVPRRSGCLMPEDGCSWHQTIAFCRFSERLVPEVARFHPETIAESSVKPRLT